ncbi:MAG: hypothetical protein Hyperionvirus1_140 [Hyperionvirus sp.]|uniref:Ankyrin repeat protein n=1 Tax=Hyperionvirus sp. TaxID=2487770 RepID=A0A3G5A8Q3_9VIRU|nr:MAG: hypothetical protein Hyperionvirus1_140 [Hyperionvirus sp.]
MDLVRLSDDFERILAEYSRGMLLNKQFNKFEQRFFPIVRYQNDLDKSRLYYTFMDAIYYYNNEKIEQLFKNIPLLRESLSNEQMEYIFLTACALGRLLVVKRLDNLGHDCIFTRRHYWDGIKKAAQYGEIYIVNYLLKCKYFPKHQRELEYYVFPEEYIDLLQSCFGCTQNKRYILWQYVWTGYPEVRYAKYKHMSVPYKFINEDIVRRNVFECIYTHAKNMITSADLFQLAHGAIYFNLEHTALYILSLVVPILTCASVYSLSSHVELTDCFKTAVHNSRWSIVHKLIKIYGNIDYDSAYVFLYNLSRVSDHHEINEIWIVDEILISAHPLYIYSYFIDEFLNQEANILRCMKHERNKVKLRMMREFDMEKYNDRKKRAWEILYVHFPAVLIDIIICYC